MLVRRNSPPNFMSCLLSFQLKPSMTWLLVSTRLRGSAEFAPGCAKNAVLPVGVGDRRMIGNPEERQEALPVGTLQSPIVLGSKSWSCEKNPSAKRFQP